MTSRPVTHFECQACGSQSPKWLGRCPECGAWDSLVEESAPRHRAAAGRQSPAEVSKLAELVESRGHRLTSGIPVLDRALGGGMVAGGAVLLGGEPGIGKSTLLLQLAEGLVQQGLPVIYLSAEESGRQLRLRADRLGCDAGELEVVAENSLEPLLALLAAKRYAVALVDSIQAVRSAELESPPGSISQVRHAANRLVEVCKQTDTALVMVGHVTKDGSLAGPKSLEHLVDTVLSFEGDGSHDYRIVRASKNRFGPAGEVAMFEMHDAGLRPIADPSRVLLSRRRGGAPGSAVTASLQGLHPLLIEVQALVHRTGFPAPRRMVLGCDLNRVVLLVAVLERFSELSFAERDVFVNVVGGLTLREPASDLAIAAALVSALVDRPLPAETVIFGEVGLLGEVRPVSRTEARLREAANLGYRTAIVPAGERRETGLDLEIRELVDLASLLPMI